MRLIELEPGQRTMPTAVFYAADGGLHEQPPVRVRPGRGRGLRRRHRRPADALDEEHPRQLADRADHRHRRRPRRPLPRRRRHLPGAPEATGRGRGRRRDRPRGARPAGVLRRRRSRRATPRPSAALRSAAQRAGFREVEFQYEPIAAAFDYEQAVRGEEKVLVADIGGGTSDFSIVRVGPERGAAGRAQGRHPRQPWRPRRRHRLRPPGRAGERPAAVRLPRLRRRQRRRSRRARCRARSTSTSRPGT